MPRRYNLKIILSSRIKGIKSNFVVSPGTFDYNFRPTLNDICVVYIYIYIYYTHNGLFSIVVRARLVI